MNASSRMAAEAAEAPARAAEQLVRNRDASDEAARRLRVLRPSFALTIARGSSDHAASFAKHLFETRLRIPVVSQSPSLETLYRATSPSLRGTLALAISQSGRSPDLVETALAAGESGALVVAMVNDVHSPLAQAADVLLPLHAGEETSVAATKSYVASLVAIADLTARWSGDARLRAALDGIEPTLESAWRSDWGAALPCFDRVRSLFVLGRGPTAPIAAEAALKFKEVAQIHAEAFSSAEVAHGPMALIGHGDPVLAFTPRDAAGQGFADRLQALAERGARIIATGCERIAAMPLPCPAASGPAATDPATTDPAVDAIAAIQSFYRFVEALARRRGLDPDAPPHLAKVTCTR